jgi:hypothetical protein
VRAQSHSTEFAQVESCLALAKHGAAITDDDQVPDTIRGKIERSRGGSGRDGNANHLQA